MLEKDLLRSIENPDAQLAAEAQAGNVDAEETLIRKYSNLVMSKTKAYFMAGADSNDVMQEGMIGLMKAVRQYDVSRNTSFATFAERCVTNQIISAIRSADRIKHKPLNTSDSLSRPITSEGGEGDSITLGDTISANLADTPEEMLIMKDVTSYILHNGDNVFSDLEMQVLGESMKGYSYDQVAGRLGRSRKSVDNALQRAKKKISNYLWK
ncbi:MAG: sigma-70 family RNA polymerase sigma factor [Clostridia bacterium]|nr:sigma-70 family RNA polymerase sigma factor [Clostridia bacterium]